MLWERSSGGERNIYLFYFSHYVQACLYLYNRLPETWSDATDEFVIYIYICIYRVPTRFKSVEISYLTRNVSPLTSQ
jgi:hypothetical protein